MGCKSKYQWSSIKVVLLCAVLLFSGCYDITENEMIDHYGATSEIYLKIGRCTMSENDLEYLLKRKEEKLLSYGEALENIKTFDDFCDYTFISIYGM